MNKKDKSVNMKTNNKPKSKLHLLSKVLGIIFTSLLLLVVGSKIVPSIIEDGPPPFSEILESFTTWDDPSAFFYTYLAGYTVIWWKPLWGSIIIILGCIFYVIIAGFDGPPIFAAPAFLVGLFYLLNWIVTRRNQLRAACQN